MYNECLINLIVNFDYSEGTRIPVASGRGIWARGPDLLVEYRHRVSVHRVPVPLGRVNGLGVESLDLVVK
jgi:hypothetical protein